MRHFPFVDPNAEQTTGEPALIVSQNDPRADSFVISRSPVSWAERQNNRWYEPRTHDIVPAVFAAPEGDRVDLLTAAF
ncbi:hypothetical protein ACGFZK_01655 [Streptomyces sp. NPDC048257]|uniref:hypothetical protein n=1 Tax=Streptomyces sp. NPDC048257 TaxID=3365526 RepID=UPI00372027C5